MVMTCSTKTNRTNQHKSRRKTKQKCHNYESFFGCVPKNCYQAPGFHTLKPQAARPRHSPSCPECWEARASGFQNKSSTGASLWAQTKRADRSPELSHYGPQTAEDNRNRLKLCRTVASEWGCWTPKELVTMKKAFKCCASDQNKYSTFCSQKIPPSPPLNKHTPSCFLSSS